MNWKDFYRSLDANDIHFVYLFTGPEAYIKQEALDALKRHLLPSGLETLNDMTLEGASAQQIIDASQTMPMMCSRRIVTVRDWAPLMSGNAKNEETDVSTMLKWLDNPCESCALVFYMRDELDGRKKMSIALKKKAAVVEFDPLEDSDLSKWCAGHLKPYGKKLGKAALSTLTFMAGRDLTRLSSELDKLSAYVGEDAKEITEADIRSVVSPSLEYNVFELMNQLLSNDIGTAQSTLNSLLQDGQNPVGILAMLTRQARQLTHMRCALDAGLTVTDVQKQLNMHPFAAKQTARQCAKLSAAWLSGLYDACVEADFAVKSGRMRDRDALDRIFFQAGLANRR